MTNTPRDPNMNPDSTKPDQRRDPANINPNGERDNDGQRRQQQAEQNKPGQQGGQRPDEKRPNDKGDKPQQR